VDPGNQAMAKLLLASPLSPSGLIGTARGWASKRGSLLIGTTTQRSITAVAASGAITITGLALASPMLRLRAQRSILPRSAIETLEHSRPHGSPIGDGVVEIGPLDLSPAPRRGSGKRAVGLPPDGRMKNVLR
jgi:hypothetical protein